MTWARGASRVDKGRWSAAALAAVSIGCGLAAVGCGAKNSLPPARYLSDEAPADAGSKTADLTLPFSASSSDTDQGDDAGLPVAAARAFARCAGGVWVVEAPDALDAVKGFDSNDLASYYQSQGGQAQPSVADMIGKIDKAGTPISYDATRGYVFMVFGDQTALAKLRTAPPDPITGLYVCGSDPQSALSALADARRETIAIDPQLNTAWTQYSARRGELAEKLQEQDMGGGSSSPMALAEAFYASRSGRSAGQFEFSNSRRMSEADLMSAIAAQIGGSAAQTGAGEWRIAAYAPGKELDARLKALKSTIDEAAGVGGDSGEDAGAGTSYAERHGQDDDSGDATNIETSLASDSPAAQAAVQEQVTQDLQVDPSVQADFDQLGVIGAGAIPTLTAYLTPTTPPSAAFAALSTLASMPGGAAGARDAVYKFIDATIATPAKSGQEVQRIADLTGAGEILGAMGALDGTLAAPSLDALQKIAVEVDLPQSLRTASRFMLLRYGVMPPSLSAAQAKWNPAAETSFSLTPPPAAPGLLNPITPTAPGAIRPLATTTTPNGEAWGVFVSDRYGSPNDIWLAHATGGQWREFLYTGKQYQVSQQNGYGSDTPIAPGDCTLQVAGDKVVIAPTNAGTSAAASLAKLQAALNAAEKSAGTNTKTMTQVETLSEKYSQLQQQSTSLLTTTYTLSLAELRRDSNGDGLTDVAAAQLGLDPQARPGTGGGQNPLLAADAGSSGHPEADASRRAMLQEIFAACYGGDASLSPIVVVLDAPFQQQFQGAPARVLCLSPEKYARKLAAWSSLRTLQFGGPTDAESSILRPDGPVLYSSDGASAEVHFWTTASSSQQSFVTRMEEQMSGGGGGGSDYIAIFQRSGSGWALKSISKMHFRSSQSESTRLAGMAAGGMTTTIVN